MKQSRKSIGLLIEDEVRRQKLGITEFAKSINKSRGDAYDIFNRNDIDIELLRRISIVLKHNFFEDLSKDLSLACPVELDDDELLQQRTMFNFLEFVPKALERLNVCSNIYLFSKLGMPEGVIAPDFFMDQFNITFSKGSTFEEKSKHLWQNNEIMFELVPDAPAKMVGWMITSEGIQFLDIAIDFKTEEEWYDTICFALDVIQTMYMPRTWQYLKKDEFYINKQLKN